VNGTASEVPATGTGKTGLCEFPMRRLLYGLLRMLVNEAIGARLGHGTKCIFETLGCAIPEGE
jgi:hypothetical protein